MGIICCKGCEKRFIGCHDVCEIYQQQKAQGDELKKKAHDAKYTNSYFVDSVIRNTEWRNKKMNEKMKELLEEVEEVVAAELVRANDKFPMFSSDHEGLAVILEEMWEAEKEYRAIEEFYEHLQESVFEDDEDSKDNLALLLQMYAIQCAAELIQVAAMCSKFVESREVRHEKSEAKESE